MGTGCRERERVGSEAIIREETKLERVFGLVTHIQFKFVQGFQVKGVVSYV